MVGAVGEYYLYVDHWVTGQYSVIHGLLATGINGRDVLAWDAPPGYLVFEGVALFVSALGTGVRRDVNDYARELTRTTGLLLVRVIDFLDRLGDGLTVGDLRLTDIRLDVEFTTHAVDQHLKVKLTHPTNDGLAGLLVGTDVESWVLFGEALNCYTEFVLVTLRLRLNGNRDHRRRESHRLEDHWITWITQGLTRGGVLEAHDRNDVSGAYRINFFTLISVHSINLADALLAVLDTVQHRGTGIKATRVNPQVGELA
ncbi:unannotated protein [freshwater metagenome]|uniref:Unannotated protein n=1 Tax=freshwater metagenome TaxID=449393 RepID=A0A6J6ZV87_9ZZZZ